MSRTVRFGDSSSSGSGSRGSGNNRHSDSGVAKDYDAQRNDIRALQDALEDAKKSASHYKSKAQRLDAELIQTRKDLREKEAQWRGLFDRSEQLEEDNKKLVLEKRDMANNMKDMSLEVDELRAFTRTLQAQLASAPPMTSAMPPPPEPKLHRSTSKKERVDPDKKRLSKRFERDTEGSDSSGGSQPPVSMKPPRPRRRDSYVEPWGPGAPQQRPVVPPSPSHSRHLDGYIATTQQGPPVTSHHRAPTFSNVPRSAGVPPIQRPTVTVSNPEPVFYDDPYEDGNYHPYPLPDRPKQRR